MGGSTPGISAEGVREGRSSEAGQWEGFPCDKEVGWGVRGAERERREESQWAELGLGWPCRARVEPVGTASCQDTWVQSQVPSPPLGTSLHL